jgi:hypothetical protein
VQRFDAFLPEHRLELGEYAAHRVERVGVFVHECVRTCAGQQLAVRTEDLAADGEKNGPA